MKKNLHHQLFRGVFLFILTLTFSSVSFAAVRYDSYQSFTAKPISLNVDLQYYKSDANFDSGGSRQSLPTGNTFQDINFASRLRWQLSDVAFLGGFNVGNSQSSDPLFVRKNSIINRIDLAAEYLFTYDIWYRFFGRLSYAHPLEKIDYAGDTVATSDGAYEINPELVLNLDFESDIYSFVKGGIILRGDGLSTLGTYGVGTEWRPTNFGIGAALLGHLTLKEDSQTDNAGYRNNYNDRVNAGSRIFTAINPNAHNLEFNFNFAAQQHTLFKIYAGTTIMGSNTSTGYYVGVNLNWIFDFVPDYNYLPSEPAKKVKQEAPIFKENTDDGVNQDYFKPVQPQNQDYIQQLQGPKKNLEEATKPEPLEPGEEEMEINTKPVKKNTPGYKIKLRKK